MTDTSVQAAQASEPEVDIPISVVVTSQSFQEKDSTDSTGPDTAESNNNLVPQLVLCGDPNQRLCLLVAIIFIEDFRQSDLL